MRTIKANSSGWVHRERPDHASFAWQTGYAAFTVSQSRRAAVTSYIANQLEHHRQMTYQEELLTLLKRHRVAYDPADLWD